MLISSFGDFLLLGASDIFNKVLGGWNAVLRLSMIPAQRIKILQQVQAQNIVDQHNSGFSGVVQNLSESGWSSFWTGSLFVMLRYYMTVATTKLRQKIERRNLLELRTANLAPSIRTPPTSYALQLFPLLLILIMTPIDTIIARSMASSPSDANFSSWNLLRESFGSIPSLFNGAPIGLLMVFIYIRLNTFIRTQLMRLLLRPSYAYLDQQKLNLIYFAASIAAGILIFPIDTIRQNMMLSTTPFDMNPLPMAFSIFMNGGFGALFAGCAVKFVTITLAGALQVFFDIMTYGRQSVSTVEPSFSALTF